MRSEPALDWSNFSKALSHEDFGDEAWLTFYLDGTTRALDELVPDLAGLRASNCGGSEGCFVYAKVPVVLSKEDIEAKVAVVRHLASRRGVNVGLIDLDPSPEIHSMIFFTLWQDN